MTILTTLLALVNLFLGCLFAYGSYTTHTFKRPKAFKGEPLVFMFFAWAQFTTAILLW